MTAPLTRPLGLGTPRHEMAMARHFLTKITDEGPLQVECAIDSINTAVNALPDLGDIDKLNDDQMLAIVTLINHMADTGQDAEHCLTIRMYHEYMKVRCALEDAAIDQQLVEAENARDEKDGEDPKGTFADLAALITNAKARIDEAISRNATGGTS